MVYSVKTNGDSKKHRELKGRVRQKRVQDATKAHLTIVSIFEGHGGGELIGLLQPSVVESRVEGAGCADGIGLRRAVHEDIIPRKLK